MVVDTKSSQPQSNEAVAECNAAAGLLHVAVISAAFGTETPWVNSAVHNADCGCEDLVLIGDVAECKEAIDGAEITVVLR